MADPSATTPDVLPTVPFRGRLLVRRLESFGDIVVGFSMSQLALQLGVPKTIADLTSDPLRYLFFFATFAVIALLWLRYHRLLTMGFAPGRIDLAATFLYLGCAALLPSALFAAVRISHSRIGAEYGLAAYLIPLFGTSLMGFVISARSYRRSRGVLDAADVSRLLVRAWIEVVVCFVYLAAFAVDFTAGAQYAGLVFFAIPIATRLIRLRIPVQGWHEVHVRAARPD